MPASAGRRIRVISFFRNRAAQQAQYATLAKLGDSKRGPVKQRYLLGAPAVRSVLRTPNNRKTNLGMGDWRSRQAQVHLPQLQGIIEKKMETIEVM